MHTSKRQVRKTACSRPYLQLHETAVLHTVLEVLHTVAVLAHRTEVAGGTAAGQGVLLPAVRPARLQGPCWSGLLVLFDLVQSLTVLSKSWPVPSKSTNSAVSTVWSREKLVSCCVTGRWRKKLVSCCKTLSHDSAHLPRRVIKYFGNG
jgi:hypothetical protein